MQSLRSFVKKFLLAAALISTISFGAITIWRITIWGFYEPASLEVDHLIAGAGDGWLLVRGALALTTAAIFIALIFTPCRWLARILFGIGAFLALWFFSWSCSAVERWAPGYSEDKYFSLVLRFRAGQSLTTEDFMNVVGPPLITSQKPTGETLWSYSYMPSSGYGWDKRFVVSRGHAVTDVQYYSEP